MLKPIMLSKIVTYMSFQEVCSPSPAKISNNGTIAFGSRYPVGIHEKNVKTWSEDMKKM